MTSESQNNSDMRTSEAEDNEAIQEHVHAQSLKVLKRLPAMGPVIMLYMQSSHRRFQFISDLEWLLLPPLVGGQCKLYMKKEYPISFISWAFLDEDAEKRLFHNGGKLRPEDWKSGENLWIIDIVAPFGGVENMLRDIQKNEFPGQTLKMIAPDPKTGGIKARVLKPIDTDSESSPDSSSSTVQ
ncbi:toxin-activating lysine-acyltransferase [Desulforhopalus sp. 52FAK]